jgi:hypothetical protein
VKLASQGIGVTRRVLGATVPCLPARRVTPIPFGVNMPTKTCTKCHTPHPAMAEFFYADKRHRDGLQSWCRVCQLAANACWAVAHPEVGQAATARWAAAHPGAARVRTARWQATYPKARKAHNAANNAIRAGRLTRPDACERCGRPSRRLDKHHADYSRPLEVEFLCRRCHKKVHAIHDRKTVMLGVQI